MKHVFYSIFALATLSMLITSCAKLNDFSLDSDSKKIANAWQWVRTDGGIGYNIHKTPASTGKNISLQLASDNKYTFYTNGTITTQGTYTIRTETSIIDHKDKPVIDFSNSANIDMMIENIGEDSLELSDNVYDGVISLYTKK